MTNIRILSFRAKRRNLLIDIFDSTVIFYHSLLDKILEQGVHLIGLGLQVVVVRRLEFQRGDEALLQLLQVQGVGLVLDFGREIVDCLLKRFQMGMDTDNSTYSPPLLRNCSMNGVEEEPG